jgi:hypothetical protein
MTVKFPFKPSDTRAWGDLSYDPDRGGWYKSEQPAPEPEDSGKHAPRGPKSGPTHTR